MNLSLPSNGRRIKHPSGSNFFVRTAKARIVAVVLPLCLAMSPRLGLAQSGDASQAERLQKLEEAVRHLQQRNAELEKEVQQLKWKGQPFAPIMPSPEQKAV